MTEKIVNIDSIKNDTHQVLKLVAVRKDRAALESIHSQYYLSIKKYISSRISSEEDVQDLVQDVFIDFCNDYQKGITVENIESYLIGIAKNILKRYYCKKIKSSKTITAISIKELSQNRSNPKGKSTYERVVSREHHDYFEKLVSNLPSKAREAIKLRFFDGYSSKEAAEIAGCDIKVFRARLYDAISLLRKNPMVNKRNQV